MEINNAKKNKNKTFKKSNVCPICKKKSLEPFNPFCSKKCSEIDLLKWLSADNAINLNSK